MNNLHIVLPYDSFAMRHLADPLLNDPGLKEVYRITVGTQPDPLADLNYHIPWHTLAGLEMPKTRHVMLYTHCNRGDEAKLRDACSRAERVVCMSFTGRQELLDLGVHPEKLWVIYAEAGAMQLRRKNIGIVGFRQPNGRKRENLLVDLMWQLDPKVSAMLNFTVVGGEMKETCQEAQNAGASLQYYENVNPEQLEQLYGSMDLLLVTGYAEGGPLPLLEAFSVGVPVLAPRIGYAGDFLTGSQLYSTLEDLMFKLTEFVRPAIENFYLARVLNQSQYIREHELLFAEMLGGITSSRDDGLDRYRQLLAIIREERIGSIVEIGTWNGERAVQMIQQALRFQPRDRVHYTGFDLFEQQTAEQIRLEFSKEAFPISVVSRRLAATGAYYQLIQGNTREKLTRANYPADLYFIDGGHSVETIASDWHNVQRMMKPGSVVVFDDYYIGRRTDEVGCNSIVDAIDTRTYRVERLPVVTKTQGIGIAMVKVRARNDADLRVQVQAQPFMQPVPSDLGVPLAASVPDLWDVDAPRPTASSGELERPAATPGTFTGPGSPEDDRP